MIRIPLADLSKITLLAMSTAVLFLTSPDQTPIQPDLPSERRSTSCCTRINTLRPNFKRDPSSWIAIEMAGSFGQVNVGSRLKEAQVQQV